MSRSVLVLTLVSVALWPLSASAEREAALITLLTGSFDNHEQVWQQGLDEVTVSERRHWSFAATDDPRRLTLASSAGQDPGPPRWRWDFETHDLRKRGEGFQILSTARAIDADDASGCRYRWERAGEGYRGRAERPRRCPAGLPVALAVDSAYLTVTPRGDGAPLQARRAYAYTGWVSLARRHIDPNAAEDDYVFMSGLSLHNEGFRLPIVDDDGTPTGYTIELARLTYQRTRTAVLKLGVIEDATGETLSYAWAGPEAQRVGINLRWVQAGLTRTP